MIIAIRDSLIVYWDALAKHNIIQAKHENTKLWKDKAVMIFSQCVSAVV